MDAEQSHRLERSGYDRPGFAEQYDQYRPRPPLSLLELLPPLAGVERPGLVVDLGSGTGLSTRCWSQHAEEVVGVEPNPAMRAFAEDVTEAPNVRYVDGSGHKTGMKDGCADLVTASQSLQWMRLDQVLPEIHRILRLGGVFCSYEYFVLQTPLWDPEAEWELVLSRKRELRAALELDEDSDRRPITRDRLDDSGAFRYIRELVLHSVEWGDGDRLLGFALSEGSMRTLLETGVTEEDVGLDRLRVAAAKMQKPVPWWIGYRAWLGLK